MGKLYQVEVDGEKFTTDDLTLDEAIQVEADTGMSWLRMNPAATASHAKAILVAIKARSVGRDEALRIYGAMKVPEVIDHIHVVDDDLPDEYVDGIPDPKEGGAPSTNGSRGAPSASGGPRRSRERKPSAT